MVLRIWQLVPPTQKADPRPASFAYILNNVFGLGVPKDQQNRAGEEIRTLGVNLGKNRLMSRRNPTRPH